MFEDSNIILLRRMQTSPKSEVKMTENVLPLPKSKLPECWTDDMRMNYLYSSIRPATVNPLDCESKMKFWSALLQDWCIHHSRPVFTLDDVKKAFLRNGRTPACLPSVLENMLKNGDLVAKSNYINDLSQQTWTAWTVDMLVKRPASWAFTKIKDTINKTPLLTSDTALVYVAACKIVSNNLISNHKEQLLELSELATLWGQQDLEQVLVLVHALRKEGKAAIQEGCPTLIKLGSPQITEVDIGVHALRKNEKTLTRHVEQLETEKQMAIQEARTYLAKNMRQAARSCLRKKHVLEKCIEQRTSALDHINVLLNRIRDAETDAKLVDAYKVGVSALKNSFKTSGLSEDSVADTMLQVQEVLDVHNEIESALAQPIQAEDADFEAELTELLKASESSKPSKLTDVVKNKVKSELDEDLLELRLNALSVADLPDPPKSRSKLPEVPVAEPAI